jgi:hypothetical protein
MTLTKTRVSSSFPAWSNIIGAIVEHAGFGSPVEPAQIEAAADADGQDMWSNREMHRHIALQFGQCWVIRPLDSRAVPVASGGR